MARPRFTIPPRYYKISIPLDVATKMELNLYSEVEGRIPHGKLSEYIANLVRKDQQERKL